MILLRNWDGLKNFTMYDLFLQSACNKNFSHLLNYIQYMYSHLKTVPVQKIAVKSDYYQTSVHLPVGDIYAKKVEWNIYIILVTISVKLSLRE